MMPELARRHQALLGLAFVMLLAAWPAGARAQGGDRAVLDRPQVETVVTAPERTVVRVRFPVLEAPADWNAARDVQWRGLTTEHWLRATEELVSVAPRHLLQVAVTAGDRAPRWRVLQTAWHRDPTDPAAAPVAVGEPRIYRGVPLAPVEIRPTAGGGVLSAVIVQIDHAPGAKAAPDLDPRRQRRLDSEPVPRAVVNPEVFRARRAVSVDTAVRAAAAATKDLPEYFALTDRWARLHVDGEGVFAVDGEQLEAMGITLAGIDPQKLRLYKGGGLTLLDDPEVPADQQPARASLVEVAITVEDGGDGEFNLDDRILFYGLGSDVWRDRLDPAAGPLEFFNHPHQDHGVYWLHWSDHGTASPLPGTPRRVPTAAAPPAGGDLVTTHRARHHAEENLVYAGGFIRDNWLWDASVLASFSRNLTLDGLLGTEPVAWQMDVCGIYGGSASDSLRGRVWMNDDLAGGTDFAFAVRSIIGQERIRISGTTTSGTAGTNSIRLRYDNYSEVQSLLGVDSFDVTYRASLDKRAYRGALGCVLWGADVPAPGRTDDVRFTLAGSAPVQVWDVSQPDSVVALAGSLADGDPATLTLGLARQSGVDRHLLLFDPRDDVLAIAGGELASPTPLRQTVPAADYLAIYPREFAAAAAELVALRSRTLPGVEDPVAVGVPVEDIYDSFSGGQKDWRAIRNFVRWHWQAHGQRVRWVCLLGDGSRDYRNFLDHDPRTELVDRVPTALITEFPPSGLPFPLSMTAPFVADDMLVSLDDPDADPDGIGVDIPDLAVGRLPATSAEDARQLVQRVQDFVEDPEPGLWRNNVVWAADDLRYRGIEPRGTEVAHTEQAENLVNNFLPLSLDVEKIYMIDYPLVGNTRPEARRDLLSRLSDGTTIFYYVGHGAANVLADEQLFRIDDVANLTNGARRFMFMAFSCDVGVFDDPNVQCMAEDFLGSSQGGGIAAVAASWVSLITRNDQLSDSFTAALFPGQTIDPTVTLSEALVAAKVDNWYAGSPPRPSNSSVRNNRRYNLLGCPALTLGHPVNDLPFAPDSSDSLLTGRIHGVRLDLAAAGMQPGSDVQYTLRAEESTTEEVYYSYTTPGGTVVEYTWLRPAGTAFRGAGVLEEDQQTIPFRAPQSLRTGPSGRLRVIVEDPEQLKAAVMRLPVVQVPSGGGDDVRGPQIQLAFPRGATRVRTGDPLSATLADTSGVNILASNPANSVLLEFDRSGIYNDVTEDVVFDAGSYTRATLETNLPPDLALGEHTVVMTASDMFGNVGSDTLQFRLESSSVAGLDNATVFPNPTPGPCRLVCELSGPMDLQWDIYTVSGRRVRSLSARFAGAGPAVLHWDGRDGEGDSIANGTYLYVLRGTPEGEKHEIRQTGQLVIMQ